ncbi:acyl-CoA-binding protein [Mucilaginibacter aquaedulcis]|uniref:acyl-CoA-binding protein n=1 Tax=Mucilaginibacter aquaedulcis TaxID=1187081 RepID=UPI0025B54A9E|nr:acyl-CoA-binding protein [Mucilaginibacter aquaedulcis]MDN3547504.1 acyl-CoA-binding protein [Mucilaginibacter aquaedulcis]
MTDQITTFETAVAQSKQLPSRPDNETLLRLYSLFKQATEGDINPENQPAMFDFVAKAKYDAWLKLKGMQATDARQQYIDLVQGLS